MIFPWNQYEELPTKRHKTLQLFVTTHCTRSPRCLKCFARHVMEHPDTMSIDEYHKAICTFTDKGGEKINLIGGEPLLHPDILWMIQLNYRRHLKTTIYTNGDLLRKLECDLSKENIDLGKYNTKIRVSLYGTDDPIANLMKIPITRLTIDVCFLISKNTNLEQLLTAAVLAEETLGCKVFFISSIRELDNPERDFFTDTELTMPVIEYKRMVHDFLLAYKGNMEIHISKRGVFESTLSPTGNQCRFANIFPGGTIIQCPYDIINGIYQPDYSFDTRFCQHNNSCLMSKIVVKRCNKK